MIIVAAAGIAWRLNSREVMANVQGMLVTEVSNALGVSVTVGQIEITSFHTVTVSDIAIFDKESQVVATGDQITVAYRLLDLLRGQAAIDTISEITVLRPKLLLKQKAGGHWNIEDLFEQTTAQEARFSGKVNLVNGTVDANYQDKEWLLENVNGDLDFSQNPTTELKLTASYNGSILSATGTVSGQKHGILNLRAERLAVADYQKLALPESSLELLGGFAQDVEVTVRRDQAGALELAGEAKLDNIAANINGLPVKELSGLVTFTHKNVYLFTNGKVFDQPVSIKGSIAIAGSQPILNLAVASPAFEPSILDAAIPLRGPVAFEATVAGTAVNPVVKGQFRLAQGEMAGYPITAAVADLQLSDKLLTIYDFHGNVLGGQLNASGTVAIENWRYQLQLKGSQLDSAILADFVPGLAGKGDIDLAISGQGLLLSDATLQGTVAMQTGAVEGIPFTALQSSFYQNNGCLTLDYLNIGVGAGMLTASGTVDKQVLKLNIRGQSVPLSLVAGRINGLVLDGNANIAGEVTGTTTAPILAASFTAVDGQAFYQPFANAKGTIRLTSQQIALQEVELVDGVTSHQINGTLGLTGQREINMTVVSHQARAENLVKLLSPGEKLTGNVDNNVTLTGPLDRINANGQLTLTEGSFRGYLLAKGEGTYRRDNGYITLNNFIIHSLNTEVKLSGLVAPNNELNLDVTAQDIDVGRMNLHFPYPVTGRANFTGKLTGTPLVPLFNGDLASASLVLNGQELKALDGQVSIEGSEIRVPHFDFTQGSGKFTFTGGMDLEQDDIYGSFDVENGELESMLALLQVPGKDISGRLNGHIRLNGTIKNPNIWLTGNLTNGKIKNYPLENVDVDVALEHNILTVNNFTAKQGQGVLAIQGTADLNGPLNLEVGGRDIDAGLLTAWFDSNLETKGTLGFTAQVSGTVANPHTSVSLEIAGGGVGNATFDSLYGLFILDKDTIHVNQLLLAKGPYRASAYGVIPVAALSPQGRQQAAGGDQMDLKVRLDEANLSILPLLTKEVKWANGQTKGEITIGGTLAQPSLTGSIFIQNGAIKLASLTDPIQKVGVDIQFEGDKINVKTFEGHMGAGEYHLTGSARLNGLTALTDYNMTLVLDKLGVNSKYFKGPLNGTVTLLGSGDQPKLSGSLLLENNTVDIPTLPQIQSNQNIGLDLEVTVGKKVRLYNSYMYDLLAEGQIKFAGTTQRPRVSGQVKVVRGTVSYLRTPFKVKEGRADFTQFGSFVPVIQLTAEAKLQQTNITLTANGPVTDMAIQLTSDSSMSQQEIFSLLTLRSSYNDKQASGSNTRDSGLGRDELVSLLDTGLQMRFVSELEGMFRDAFGLDEFRLVRGLLTSDSAVPVDREAYNLQFGKYITDRLMLSYTMGLDNHDYNMAFRYDLSKRISLTGSRDSQNNSLIGFETRFKF
jgi:translocation and assembly module TamB